MNDFPPSDLNLDYNQSYHHIGPFTRKAFCHNVKWYVWIDVTVHVCIFENDNGYAIHTVLSAMWQS